MTFSGLAIDPADRLRGDDHWLGQQLASQRSRFLALSNLEPLIDLADPSRLAWVSGDELRRQTGTPDPFVVFLGLGGDIAHFAVAVDDLRPLNAAPFGDRGRFVELRAAAMVLGQAESAVAARARALIDWHQRHGFCAQCGTPTVPQRGGTMRRCSNDACRAMHFPRVDPVVIMLILRGAYCLLGRQARFPGNMYSALAGFMEPGETIEETVRRESLEEAGIRIGAVRYIASQPWPFPSNLMIGCEAEALSEDIHLDRIELEDAMWVAKDDIRRALAGDPALGFSVPPPFAIAHQLLRGWAS